MIPHIHTLFEFISTPYENQHQTLYIKKIDRGQIRFREYSITLLQPLILYTYILSLHTDSHQIMIKKKYVLLSKIHHWIVHPLRKENREFALKPGVEDSFASFYTDVNTHDFSTCWYLHDMRDNTDKSVPTTGSKCRIMIAITAGSKCRIITDKSVQQLGQNVELW